MSACDRRRPKPERWYNGFYQARPDPLVGRCYAANGHHFVGSGAAAATGGVCQRQGQRVSCAHRYDRPCAVRGAVFAGGRMAVGRRSRVGGGSNASYPHAATFIVDSAIIIFTVASIMKREFRKR